MARSAAAVIVLGVVLRVALVAWAEGTMVDDAYITVRYAQHLINEGALVYNTGEHVLGVTGPLYALWVAGHLLAVPAKHIGYALGVSHALIFAATAWMLLRALSEAGRRTGLLVIVFLAVFPRFVDNSIAGMETPLFLLGMAGSLVLLKSERYGYLSLLASLMVLVRPEGTLWAVSLLAVMVLRRSRLRLVDIVPGAVVLGVWTAFSSVYYGSPIPQSVWAKCGWIVPRVSSVLTHRIASVFSALTLLELPRSFARAGPAGVAVVVVSLASLALFALGTRELVRRRSVLCALPVLFLLYFACYLAAKGRVDFSWYGIPSGLAYGATATIGLSCLARRFIPRRRRETLFGPFAVVLVVSLAVGSVIVWEQSRLPYVRALRSSYEPAGEFIARHCDPDARVLLSEVGMIGWRADRPTHELAGIVSPEILQYCSERQWNATLQEVLARFGTDIVVLDPSCVAALEREGGAAWVERNYAVLADFPRHTVLQKRD